MKARVLPPSEKPRGFVTVCRSVDGALFTPKHAPNHFGHRHAGILRSAIEFVILTARHREMHRHRFIVPVEWRPPGLAFQWRSLSYASNRRSGLPGMQ
jgi:hypothetical protein